MWQARTILPKQAGNDNILDHCLVSLQICTMDWHTPKAHCNFKSLVGELLTLWLWATCGFLCLFGLRMEHALYGIKLLITSDFKWRSSWALGTVIWRLNWEVKSLFLSISSEYQRLFYVLLIDPAAEVQGTCSKPCAVAITYFSHSSFTKMLCGLYVVRKAVLHTQHPIYSFSGGLSTGLYFEIDRSVSGQKNIWSTKAYSHKALKIISHFSMVQI